MRIAIVNDLALAREVLRRLIQSVPGYSVAWSAEGGEIAVRLAHEQPPDLILMDLIVTASVAVNFEMVCAALGAGGLDAVDTPVFGPGGVVLNGDPLLIRLDK